MLITQLVLGLLMSQTPSTLEIVDAVVGKGQEVRIGDVVSVEYTGTLVSGKQFDSNKGKPPFVFQVGVGQVIKGWDQGLLGMKTGGQRKLTIPADLAYGNKEAGDIPANSVLKFDVRLIKIEDRVKVEVTKAGEGDPAIIGELLEVHYRGTLANGTEFDNSFTRGRPMKFVLGQRVIPGFTQGVLGIKKGEKRKFTIPPVLAYGARPIPPEDITDPDTKKVVKAGSVIPPNSTLTFEVELISRSKVDNP